MKIKLYLLLSKEDDGTMTEIFGSEQQRVNRQREMMEKMVEDNPDPEGDRLNELLTADFGAAWEFFKNWDIIRAASYCTAEEEIQVPVQEAEPDLLAQLQACVSVLEATSFAKTCSDQGKAWPVLDDARAAITKAKDGV